MLFLSQAEAFHVSHTHLEIASSQALGTLLS